jgi:hypothetical protein
MPASYADTLAYDLVVVFFVAVLMPAAVLLLRGRTAPAKCGGAALLALSVLYVGGFEHYRLHAPEARRARGRGGRGRGAPAQGAQRPGAALARAAAMQVCGRGLPRRARRALRPRPVLRPRAALTRRAAQGASERVRAMLLATTPEPDGGRAAGAMPRRALLAALAAARRAAA